MKNKQRIFANTYKRACRIKWKNIPFMLAFFKNNLGITLVPYPSLNKSLPYPRVRTRIKRVRSKRMGDWFAEVRRATDIATGKTEMEIQSFPSLRYFGRVRNPFR